MVATIIIIANFVASEFCKCIDYLVWAVGALQVPKNMMDRGVGISDSFPFFKLLLNLLVEVGCFYESYLTVSMQIYN